MSDLPRVISPIGWGAGRTVPLFDALQDLAVEMLGQRNDRAAGIVLEPISDETERFATALLVIANQVRPVNEQSNLITLALRHGLAVPQEWLKKPEEKSV